MVVARGRMQAAPLPREAVALADVRGGQGVGQPRDLSQRLLVEDLLELVVAGQVQVRKVAVGPASEGPRGGFDGVALSLGQGGALVEWSRGSRERPPA